VPRPSTLRPRRRRRRRRAAGLLALLLPTLGAGPVPDRFDEPVYPSYLADPYVWRVGDTFYAVGTGGAESRGQTRPSRVLPIARSRDLQHWESLGLALNPPTGEEHQLFWAPETATDDGAHWFLYYTAGGRGGHPFRVRVATADHPEGPYTDTGRPLTDPADTNRFAIDPDVFRDDDGQRYLLYATDFYDADPTATPPTYRGTALALRHMRSMTELDGPQITLMRAHAPWQLYQKQRLMAGVRADWYTLEGPTVLKRAGRYYCFYSGGNYQDDTYGLNYLTADHITGPWRDAGDGRGPQVMRTVPGHVLGPGHNSVVRAADGREFIAYHAWDAAFQARQMWVDPLRWTPDGRPFVDRFVDRIAQANATPR
jgi:beta-xylosidase